MAPRAGSSAGRRPASGRWRSPRSSRATRPGISVLLAESAKVSAVPSMNSATSTMAMLTVPVTIVATRTASTTARPRFTTTTIRRRSTRSATAPPRTPNSRTGRYSAQQRHRDEQRVPCLRGDEQRTGRDGDAVAGVVDDGRREEPAEAPSEPRRHDGLDDRAGQDAHRGEDNPTPKTPGARLGAAAVRRDSGTEHERTDRMAGRRTCRDRAPRERAAASRLA